MARLPLERTAGSCVWAASYSPKVLRYKAKIKPIAVAIPVQYFSFLNAFGKTSKASDATTAPPAKHFI